MAHLPVAQVGRQGGGQVAPAGAVDARRGQRRPHRMFVANDIVSLLGRVVLPGRRSLSAGKGLCRLSARFVQHSGQSVHFMQQRGRTSCKRKPDRMRPLCAGHRCVCGPLFLLAVRK